jgi:DNA-binding NtrC family response regulator
MAFRVLLIQAPSRELAELRAALKTSDVELVEPACTAADLSLLLDADSPLDLVLVPFPEGDGTTIATDVLRDVRTRDAELPVVAVAARGDVNLASQAIAAGATDFLVLGDRLPERVRTLLGKVRRLVALVQRSRTLLEQNQRLRQAVTERSRLIGESPQIREVLHRIARVSAIPRPVLIVGERGTGKELVARAIHEASGRADRPFIAVNCAALPETLLESELFGHERGAFTGAERQTPGKFEQASGGTIFLDEISHMPLGFQQKILRVVEYGTFARLGGTREIRTNARVLAATNADLEEAIRGGQFLADLHDRLAFEVVRVPSLRERAGDVRVLARHFLREFLREVPALGAKAFAEDAMAALERYPFPGNVRELKTIIERAAYRDTTQEINLEDLALRDAVAAVGGTFHERVNAYERQLLHQALAAASGNQAEAARRLGLAYHRFRYYARKLLLRHAPR